MAPRGATPSWARPCHPSSGGGQTSSSPARRIRASDSQPSHVDASRGAGAAGGASQGSQFHPSKPAEKLPAGTGRRCAAGINPRRLQGGFLVLRSRPLSELPSFFSAVDESHGVGRCVLLVHRGEARGNCVGASVADRTHDAQITLTNTIRSMSARACKDLDSDLLARHDAARQ